MEVQLFVSSVSSAIPDDLSTSKDHKHRVDYVERVRIHFGEIFCAVHDHVPVPSHHK